MSGSSRPRHSPTPPTAPTERRPPDDPNVRRRRFIAFLGITGLGIAVLILIALRSPSEDDAPSPNGDRVRASSSETAASGAPSERGDEATTAAPTTTTTPLRQATLDDPLRILVAGDSLVGYLPLVLEEAVADRPAVVIDEWKGSSGLARPDFHDWPAALTELMEEHDPDVVVIGFGGNDTQGLAPQEPGDPAISRDQPEWETEYTRRVGLALDAVEAPGRTLWWIGLPLSDRANLEEMRPAMTAAFESEIASRPWAEYVDTLEVLAPDGTYAVHLPGPDGEPVRVRADDGIHLSPSGMRMILDLFLPEILERHGLEADAAASVG